MIKNIRYNGHLPTISAFDFLSYCLLLGIMSLVLSLYEEPIYGPHSVDDQRYNVEAGIGFSWLGVRVYGAWDRRPPPPPYAMYPHGWYFPTFTVLFLG